MSKTLFDLLRERFKTYTRLTWSNGIQPPLSAENLNKTQDALDILLGKFDANTNANAICKIVDEVEKNSNRIDINSEAIGKPSDNSNQATGIYKLIENNKKDTDNSIVRINSNISSISTKVDQNTSKIGTASNENKEATGIYKLLEKLENTTTTKIKDLGDNTSTRIEQVDSKIGKPSDENNEATGIYKYTDTKIDDVKKSIKELQDKEFIYNEDELILKCGSATEILFKID